MIDVGELSRGSANPRGSYLEEFRQIFTPYVNKWKTHQGADLGMRLETGQAINGFIGGPDKRFMRGAGVVENAADWLGITPGEVSRLRWFAHHFESLEDLKDRYSEATSWAAVKAILPKLNAERQGLKKGQGEGASPDDAKKVKTQATKRVNNLLERFEDEFTKV